MNNTGRDAEVRKLREVAAEYEARGYEVLVQPGPQAIPEFLAGFQPDLIARSPNESVVVEVKVGTSTAASERYRELAERIQHQPGWRFSLVVVDPRAEEVAPATKDLIEVAEITERIRKAKDLAASNSADASFLLMWASIEALLRHVAKKEGLPIERLPTSALLKELFSQGVLSRADLDIAQRGLAIRNALVHGFATSGLQGAVGELVRFANRLLSELGHTEA